MAESRSVAIYCVFLVALSASLATAAGFEGTWVLRRHGQNILKLTLVSAHEGRLSGAITKPRDLRIDQDGGVSGIGPDQVTLPVQKSELNNAGQLELTIDGDLFTMALEPPNRARLSLQGMRPWTLERVERGRTVTLAATLTEPHYPAEIAALRRQLHAMVKADQDARLALDQARFEAEDARNEPGISRIFERFGWVRNSLAGENAAHDFWLLVQHQTPELQRRFLPALEKAAKAGDASMSDYAYLYDRVQVGLHRPQRWGTQIECKDGRPALAPVADAAGLDARRKALFLQPVNEYLKSEYLAALCAVPVK